MKNRILLLIVLALLFLLAIESSSKDEEVSLFLSTGKVVQGKFIPSTDKEPRRLATIKLKESYITWKNYLDGKPRDRIHFDAALPSLIPYDVNKKISKGSDVEKHKQWVRIELGLYGFANQLCDTPCSRKEHNQKANAYKQGMYERIDSENAIENLTKRVSDSNAVFGGELYTPNFDHDVNDIVCRRPTGRYRWCDVTSSLNNNIYLNYHFEYAHLENWEKVDQIVRKLANKILVEHSEF